MHPHGTTSTWQECSNWVRCVLETTLTSRYTAPPAGTTMQETCSHLHLLDTLQNSPVPGSLKFWTLKQSFSGRNLGMGRWVEKKGAAVPVSTGCDDHCHCCWWKCQETGDWELLLYCICDYIPSPSLYILFFPLPETSTCKLTLWKLRTRSCLPSGGMKPTSSLLSSVNKNLLILPERLQSFTFSPFMPQRAYPASL